MAPPPYAPTLALGLKGETSTLVTPELTAVQVGSGTVAVYATPMLIALMERAAVACVEDYLAPGHASLGTQIDAAHIAATPPGATVTAIAEIVEIDGRKLTFDIAAHDGFETVGRARHTRVVVDVARFQDKLARKAQTSAQL